ncbi:MULTISPECIES: hypothetical protein [Phyllobacteriaceae]|jgi:hypothetical protein|uniref:Ammonium transporter AmtB-like domain-containing protein n=1 Tax=Ollibium composti TaxID=2675109 RepID=A0ABY2Q342_9HYPH|nr:MULTISPECIES: hypothetical protein [Mesorhizobium]QDC00959.1 hypothetical protein FGU64_11305 [Mesorhizobium sp. 8]THF55119.1 hypothetical protein E6C48_19730 [Mesorhizobium composti]
MMRSSTLQRTAEIVMVLGIVALCQPWSLFLHRYGVTIVIVGLVTFMFTNWFGKPGVTPEDTDGVFDVSDHNEGRA